MRINRIQNNSYNTRPNFGAMKITEKGETAMLEAFTPEQLKQVSKWEKELESTKHYDLEIDAVMDSLFYTIDHKTNHRLSSEGPLHPVEIKGKKLEVCGVDLLDCGDWFYYDKLNFPTAKEAAEAYATLTTHKEICKPYKRNDFNRLEWAVDSVKILDKAFEYQKNSAISDVVEVSNKMPEKTCLEQPKTEIFQKPSLTQRIKNAWQALKGS